VADAERTDGTGLNLRGQTLIVTGASKGIGRALTSELAQNGVNLVLNARSEASLEEAAADARKSGVHVLTVVGDAALADNARETVKAAVGMGEFIGFIHNAGTGHPSPFLYELPEVLFEDVWRSNVLAGYQLAYFSYPELRRMGRGLAVFFGSGAAESNIEGIGAYCLSKAAEEHMARQLATEVPEVTCFVYRPGTVETDMQKAAREAEGSGAEVLHRIFGGFKEQGILMRPETAARALVQIIRNDPPPLPRQDCHLQGRTATPDESKWLPDL
jgi:NAD(P)-dependent dehydrogenase (short-subunit alcohol dehydrogenase family)